MKTKIKRHSRSVISVVLAVCMLISCMTVGIIATDAAKVGDNGAVAATSDSDSVGAQTYYYRGGDNSWGATAMTVSADGFYEYIQSSNSSNQFKIAKSASGYDYNYTYVDKGFNSTNVASIGDYDKDNCYCWQSGTYYILVYYPNTSINSTNNPKICASTTLPDNTPSYYVHYGSGTSKDNWNTHTKIDETGFDVTLNAGEYTGAINMNSSGVNSDNTGVESNFTVSATPSTVTPPWDGYVPKYDSNVAGGCNGFKLRLTKQATVHFAYNSSTKIMTISTDAAPVETNYYIIGDTALGNGIGWVDGDNRLLMTKSGDDYTYTSSELSSGTFGFRLTTSKTGWQTDYGNTKLVPVNNSYIQAKAGDDDNNISVTFKQACTITVRYDTSEDKIYVTANPAAQSTLYVNDISDATVTATYNGQTAVEGGHIDNIPAGASVTITVVADDSTKTGESVTTSPSVEVPGTGRTFTLTMPAQDTRVTGVTLRDITTKRVYFNNYYTRYAMVSAYVKYSDGTEPLGAWAGKTMTRIENTNTWYVEVPEDAEFITFIGDNGYNTNDETAYPAPNPDGMMTIPWSNTNPMYTAPYGHNDAPTKTNGGSWEKSYTARTNEITVSNGTTLNNSNLFTGITATMYDYYVDSEVNGSWRSSIGSRDYSQDDGSAYDWNPYHELNHALDKYARVFGVATPLYFGNLNTKNQGDVGQVVNTDTFNNNQEYYNWSLTPNNSLGLSNSNNALTGLSGTTLAGSNIHYYDKDGSGENGAIMAMFDEDFLSGQNDRNKVLAQILRSSAFPVRKSTISEKPTELYLDTSGYSNWENDNAIIKADFYNSYTTESTKQLVTATKVSDHLYKVTIPAGYTHVQWWRMDPSSPNVNPWNYGTEDLIPSDEKFTYKLTGDNKKGSWVSDSSRTLGSHTYYEFDSTDGKDNAYITNISGNTAKIDYYASSDNKKVHAATATDDPGAVGFFPFDFEQSGSGTGGLAKDLGFGMKLEIPFTLEQNGEFADGTPQVFNFSGDDDLWVFVDGKLVLDLGGDHNRTEGSINFADKTVTANNTQALGSAARNGSFDWFDNSNPNQPHTMTIYYMERGMYDSNLKFGFSFHAIPNQFKTEKKVRTYDVNSGFYIVNSTTKSDNIQIDGRDVTKFEETYQNEKFTVTHQVKPAGSSSYSGITGKEYTLGSNTYTVGSTGTYQLKNDDIAYFLKQFTKGDTFKISESPDSSNLYTYEQSVAVYDDANNNQQITGTGDATNGYEFTFNDTHGTTSALDNLNIRARFTNSMKTHNLTLSKAVTDGESDSTEFTFRVTFKFGDYDYMAYPLYCVVDGENTQLNADGTVTVKQGHTVSIQKIPENALIKVEEINIPKGYNFSNYSITGASASTASNGAQFAMGTQDIGLTITNAQFSGFTIIKELKYSPEDNVFVDYPDNDSVFRIKVEQSTDNGSSYSALANQTFTSSDASRINLTTDADGITTIKRGEKLSFNNIASSRYIRVTEDTQESTYANNVYTVSDHMPLDYQLRDVVAMHGDDSIGTTNNSGYYHGIHFVMPAAGERVDVTVTNIKPRYTYLAKYTYTTRNKNVTNPANRVSMWGDLSYHAGDTFSAEDLYKYTQFARLKDYNQNTVRGIEFKSDADKAEFFEKKTAPYEDNFRQDITWEIEEAPVEFHYGNNETACQLVIAPTPDYKSASNLSVSFYLPCKMKMNTAQDELIVDTSSLQGNNPKAKLNNGYPVVNIENLYTCLDKLQGVKFADWYTTNSVSVGASDPKFVTAPKTVYDVDSQTVKYFQYWSVRTMENDQSNSAEYTKVYSNEFNYVFFRDSEVYAVYGDTQGTGYEHARTTQDSTASIFFLENSRNQWNQKASGQIATDFKGANNVKYGDRMFSDFVIDYHYVKDGQNLLLKSEDADKYKAGLLIETVRALNSSEVDTANQKMLKTDKQIADSFKSSENVAARNAALAYISGPMTDKTKYLNSNISISSLDNKNEYEIAYSFANISQTAEYRTETTRKMQLYRAYSYLIDNTNSEKPVRIISEPVYFTIYDMASIVNEYDVAQSNK